MTERSCLSIILAAGEGTRMKSAMPKVLHAIAGLPMVAHVVKAAEAAGATGVALVIGHGADEMRKAAQKFAPEAETLITSPLGSSRPKAVTVVNWDAATAAAAAAALGSGMRDRQIV